VEVKALCTVFNSNRSYEFKFWGQNVFTNKVEIFCENITKLKVAAAHFY